MIEYDGMGVWLGCRVMTFRRVKQLEDRGRTGRLIFSQISGAYSTKGVEVHRNGAQHVELRGSELVIFKFLLLAHGNVAKDIKS
jgi:hypothetical protein